MKLIQTSEDVLFKEHRVHYWDRFGVIFPDACLKDLIAEDREVAM